MNPPLAVCSSSDYFCYELVGQQCPSHPGISKEKLFSNSDLSPRSHQALPLVRLVGNLLGEQHLNLATQEIPGCRILGAQWLGSGTASSAIEAGWKHTRVVENHQVSGTKRLRKVGKTAVGEASRSAVKVQHAGSRSVGKRLLRDQLLGKSVIELRDEHTQL
jgi:hypothetical protein